MSFFSLLLGEHAGIFPSSPETAVLKLRYVLWRSPSLSVTVRAGRGKERGEEYPSIRLAGGL
jgi:hypothetical protein